MMPTAKKTDKITHASGKVDRGGALMISVDCNDGTYCGVALRRGNHRDGGQFVAWG